MKYISNGLCLFSVIFYIDARKVNERNFYRAVLLFTVTLLHRKTWICHWTAAKDHALQRVFLDFPRDDAPPPTGVGFNGSGNLLFCHPAHSLPRPKRR